MVNVSGIAGEALAQYVERIERLMEEKKALADDIKDIYAEAKSTGFDPKIMRAMIKRRSVDRGELEEYEALLELYEYALRNQTPIEKSINKSKDADTAPTAH